MGGYKTGPIITAETDGWIRDPDAERALVESGRLERSEAKQKAAARRAEAIAAATDRAKPKKAGGFL